MCLGESSGRKLRHFWNELVQEKTADKGRGWTSNVRDNTRKKGLGRAKEGVESDGEAMGRVFEDGGRDVNFCF